jgi:hypothetical protein
MDPVCCHNCGCRMIQVLYCYDTKNRKKAWLCTHCGRLVRFLKMSDGRYLPVPIWRGKILIRRKTAI